MKLPLRLPWDIAQDRWAAMITPSLESTINQGLMVKGQALGVGATVINHKLGRLPQGWILVDQDAPAQIYRSAPFTPLTLTLTSNAATTVALWVF